MNNSGTAALLMAGILAAGLGVVIGFGGSWGAFVIIAMLGTLFFAVVGSRMRTEIDGAWLQKWIVMGFLGKIGATLARHYTVTVVYEGGDAFRYYEVATDLGARWAFGDAPGLTGGGAFGTQVVEWITGGLFAIYTPDLLGGFMVFSVFAFGGQLMLYSAFRIWARPNQLKPYAALILFLPTFAFWPSSIGKDALIIFALGGAAYFSSRILKTYQLRWVLGLMPFIVLVGLIRIHIVALIMIGLIGAALIARMPPDADAGTAVRRLTILGVFIASGALVLSLFPDIFGVDLTSGNEIDAFAADVVRRTTDRGWSAAGESVAGPTDVPAALALVLFRPFLWEAFELQHYFAAVETALLVALTIWKLPAIARNWRSWRANGYVVFSTIYTVAYAVAFSVVRNLGIIARQRGQVLVFFLCIVVILGWDDESQAREDASGASRRGHVPRQARLRTGRV